MSVSEESHIPENQLLAALPPAEFQRLTPHLRTVSLSLGDVLYRPDEEISWVYFPTEAVISLVSILESGATTEVGLVGNEGMLGLPVVWGGDRTKITTAVVQVGGRAMQMSATQLKTLCAGGSTLQRLLLLYTQALFGQVSQSAACNRHHTIEQRLARWLLWVHDRVNSDELQVTQEFIATMLGTRRSGVTVAAGMLQERGLIRYTRGKITIVNRERLESTACECYKLTQDEFERLLQIKFN
ncbi:Crp/Fnr family transcriptional regulator [Phormidium sp. CCY1219]|uniref:Crp/Fnr family transcriptional regulator n=1 Tax=Phormidium sp. CCY1219 TaxID=2886104 RepID=UPI002D1F5A2D|nr:Crp/Fnr family transcriptional regulator [Phormidium sp. CCY1219]MEB3831635.1 Crp/Fnr family transcriptional regulator [Phormidium sp. CCY1219]